MSMFSLNGLDFGTLPRIPIDDHNDLTSMELEKPSETSSPPIRPDFSLFHRNTPLRTQTPPAPPRKAYQQLPIGSMQPMNLNSLFEKTLRPDSDSDSDSEMDVSEDSNYYSDLETGNYIGSDWTSSDED